MDQILFSTFHKSLYWIQYEECFLKCGEQDLCHEAYFLSQKWYPQCQKRQNTYSKGKHPEAP